MVFGYIRISTDKQSVENQRYEIQRYCELNNLQIDIWIEEVISGKKEVKDRKLGKTLNKMVKDDILICSELSRLGRNLFMIMSVLNECMLREICIYTVKENYQLGNDINSKVLAFAFGLSAEIERNLISQRTKEALARKKSEGIVLGRPYGSKSINRQLFKHKEAILKMLSKGIPQVKIAKKYGVHRHTLSKFLQDIEQ